MSTTAADAGESADDAEGAEVTAAGDGGETAAAAEGATVGEPTQGAKAAKAAKSGKSGKAAKNAKSAKSGKAAKSIKNAKSTKDAESADDAGATEAVDATEATELTNAEITDAEITDAEITDAEITDAETTYAADTDADPKTWVAASTRRTGRGPRVVAAALLIVLLTAAGVEGWFVFQRHQRDAAASAALDAATAFTIKLANIDPDAIDQTFAAVLDGSTGRFHDLYAQSGEQLRQALIDNAAAAHGTVLEAAVKSATKNKVEVMLFVDQSVRNNKLPQPQLDRSRIIMTLDKVDGRWLVSDIEHP